MQANSASPARAADRPAASRDFTAPTPPATMPARCTRDDITGLLLAGGRGRRMGGADKGLLLLDGMPLAEHVLRSLRPQVAHLLISANRHRETYEAWAPVVVDPDPGAFAGPLTGILAGLRAATTDWVAVAPCDLPSLPSDAVARLAAGLGDASAAYAAPAGQRHSLVCLLHRSLAPTLAQALHDGEARVAAWFGAVGARAVPFDDAAAFANLNSQDDLAAVARGTA